MPVSVYNLLRDREATTVFVEHVISPLEEDHALVLLLLARRKYLTPEDRESLTISDSAVVRREVVTRASSICDRIAQMCVPVGAYTDRGGVAIPEHAMGVYLSVNPRSQRAAALATIQDLAEGLFSGRALRVDRIAFAHLHKSPASKPFLDLDVDPAGTDDLDAILAALADALGSTPTHAIQTRGGAHVLIRTKALDPAVKKTFYRAVQTISDDMDGEIEIRSDAMVPVPGTCHGGVTPHLLGAPY